MARWVKLWLRTSPSHIGVPVPVSIQLPADALRRAADGSPSAWAPAPTWETLMEFQSPGFGLAHPKQLWSFGE